MSLALPTTGMGVICPDTRRRFRIRPTLIFYARGGAAYPSITPATSLAGLLDMRQVVHRDATDGTLSPVEFRLNRALLFDAVSEHREHGRICAG